MKKQNNTSQKVILGLVASGLLVAVAATASRWQKAETKKSPLKKIGRTICEIGEMIEDCDLDKKAYAYIKEAEEKVSNSDFFGNFLSCIDSGLTIWKHFKKR